VAISPPRIALSVRPRDPAPIWFALRFCVLATMALSVAGFGANLYDALVSPDEYNTSLLEQAWRVWYAFGAPAGWAIFAVALILLMWLTYRLARNLHGLAPNRFTLSPTYAIAYYLVPIANIIMPPRITGLIARATFDAADAPRQLNGLIGWWWGTFLLTALLSNVATVVAANSGVYDPNGTYDQDAYASSIWIGAAAWVANIVSCYFMLRVFEPISRAQTSLIHSKS
jgi:hypothetical protein